MTTTLNTKTLYVGEEQGEVLCIKCAGVLANRNHPGNQHDAG